jgi:hypothetical protein
MCYTTSEYWSGKVYFGKNNRLTECIYTSPTSFQGFRSFRLDSPTDLSITTKAFDMLFIKIVVYFISYPK